MNPISLFPFHKSQVRVALATFDKQLRTVNLSSNIWKP